MGAILLINREKTSFQTERSLKILSVQLSSKPIKLMYRSWDIYYYSKMLSRDEPQILDDRELMIICGTAIVPFKTRQESINEIHNSLKCSRKPPDNLIGNYLIFFADSVSMEFFLDPMNFYSTYVTLDNSAISTSFLALAAGIKKFTLNRNALIENLVTGSIIGNDTILSDINRLNNNLRFERDGLRFIPQHARYSQIPVFKSKKESQEQIVRKLSDYFQSLKPFAEEHGIDTGLTGGYDSRLLLALTMKHFSSESIQVHSHSRNGFNLDLQIAQKISREMDFPLHTVPVRDLLNSSLDSVLSVMEKSMLFCDGQIRTNSYWYEEYNTENYRKKILNGKRLGLAGIGGEIFRNQERSCIINQKLTLWIKFNVIRHYAGEVFHENTDENELKDYILSKLQNFQEINFSSSIRISSLQKKIYLNHIYIQAGRGLRLNSENRLSWFLNPFTHPSITITALGAVPFNGISLDYESELLKLIDPKLTLFDSSYGYNFDRGEPFRRYFTQFCVRNFIPPTITNKLRIMLHPRSDYREQCSDLLVEEYFRNLAGNVRNLGLPIDIDRLLFKPDLAHLIISTGFFLEKLNNIR
jgi:hypothetical protein